MTIADISTTLIDRASAILSLKRWWASYQSAGMPTDWQSHAVIIGTVRLEDGTEGDGYLMRRFVVDHWVYREMTGSEKEEHFSREAW